MSSITNIFKKRNKRLFEQIERIIDEQIPETLARNRGKMIDEAKRVTNLFGPEVGLTRITIEFKYTGYNKTYCQMRMTLQDPEQEGEPQNWTVF